MCFIRNYANKRSFLTESLTKIFKASNKIVTIFFMNITKHVSRKDLSCEYSRYRFADVTLLPWKFFCAAPRSNVALVSYSQKILPSNNSLTFEANRITLK